MQRDIKTAATAPSPPSIVLSLRPSLRLDDIERHHGAVDAFELKFGQRFGFKLFLELAMVFWSVRIWPPFASAHSRAARFGKLPTVP